MTTPTSRRRVLVGAAWSGPVITMASAAPALAASRAAAMSVTAIGTLATDTRLFFSTNVDNVGAATTTDLKAMVQVTAQSAAVWGASPTAIASSTVTSANWTFVSISGSGAVRTFVFDAVTEFPAGGPRREFDLTINTNGGNIGSGTLVRSFIPGGSGVPAQLDENFSRSAKTAAGSPRTGRS